MKYIANLITALRIIVAIAMLFTIPLSVPFFWLYAVGGLSDMIDGTVARRCGSAGDFVNATLILDHSDTEKVYH